MWRSCDQAPAHQGDQWMFSCSSKPSFVEHCQMPVGFHECVAVPVLCAGHCCGPASLEAYAAEEVAARHADQLTLGAMCHVSWRALCFSYIPCKSCCRDASCQAASLSGWRVALGALVQPVLAIMPCAMTATMLTTFQALSSSGCRKPGVAFGQDSIQTAT